MTPPSEPRTGGLPEFTPRSQDDLRDYLAGNFTGSRHPLTPVGGRTAFDLGGRLSKPAVDLKMARLERVIDFPARDMTVTVEAGIRVNQLAEILKAEGQRLPIDVAQADRATLGGAIATNTSGPRRFGFGTFRDYVIGMTAITADGRVFHSGGRVVKNVAGYDLCKLLVGSLGTLAVITQVTLKLKPVPESSVLVWATFETIRDREAAVEALLKSETRPVAIETLSTAAARWVQNGAQVAVDFERNALVVGFEGSCRETDWQTETLRRELAHPSSFSIMRGSGADRLWNALIHFPVSETAALTFQASLLPSKLALLEEQVARFGLETVSRAGDGILIGRIGEPTQPSAKSVDVFAALIAWIRQNGGSVVLKNATSELQTGVLANASLSVRTPLMAELKAAFDPAGLLNPGRLIAEVPS